MSSSKPKPMKCLTSVLLLSFALFFSSCQREEIRSADCYTLHNALIAKDANQINKAFNNLSLVYSRENLEKLAENVSGQCEIRATVLCFECIKTYPPQTEMRFSFSHLGATVERIVDLSYTSERRIRVVNVHD